VSAGREVRVVEASDVLDQMPFPLGVTRGPEHVVELLNPAAREILGARKLLGHPIREALPEIAAQGLVELLDNTYRGGEPYGDPAQRVLLERDGRLVECWFSVGYAPLRQPDGTVSGLLLHAVETTDQVRATRQAQDGLRLTEAARTRSTALQQLAEALSRAATPAAIGELAAARAAELLGADAASVFVHTPDGLEQVHNTGWPDDLWRRYRFVALTPGRPLSDAVLTGTPVWLQDAEQWRVRYPEMAPVHEAGGYEASACLPLRMEDRDLGGLVFSFTQPRAFDHDEREYLLAVAALCAQALDRARLYVAERDARTAAEQQRDRMGFLAEASLLLDAPLSVEARMQRLADLVVPGIADWCAATLVRGDRVEQVAVAHSDPDKVAFVRQLQERYPPNPDVAGSSIHVARTGVASFVPKVSDELLLAAATDDTHLELIRRIGIRSIIIVPLRVRDRSLGSLTLVNAESEHLFDDVDLTFAEQLAGRAALALDNARLYEQQRTIAHTLQTALLPSALPVVPGVRLAARYLAQAEGAEVGGDVYDVFAGAKPDHWSVMLGDVCGKGPAAAALTALIRYTVRAEAGHGLAPAAALRRLNDAILRQSDPVEARFATVAHGQLRVGADGAALTLVSAGHLPALVLRGERVELVQAPGTLLGVFPDPELSEVEVHIGRGDTVLLYTDGVTEARGVDGLYGTERLVDLLGSCSGHSPDAIADTVVADVVAFQDGRLCDDVALLVLQASR
jgi:serine phosphatase RsbU (regulator of sigma subunit)